MAVDIGLNFFGPGRPILVSPRLGKKRVSGMVSGIISKLTILPTNFKPKLGSSCSTIDCT